MVRVRGLYLPHDEGSGMMYDICSFLEHNGQRLLDQGKGPFLYVKRALLLLLVLLSCVTAAPTTTALPPTSPHLASPVSPLRYVPKLESYEEAVFVNSVISECEDYLGLPIGCTKVTVLGETFPAIFQTDEIIFALKDRIVGINCGRWDYLFSMIKYVDRGRRPPAAVCSDSPSLSPSPSPSPPPACPGTSRKTPSRTARR